MLINSFFSRGGMPAVGLIPNIAVWEISVGAQTKILNNINLTEIGEGLYFYNFAAYNASKEYIYFVDGGPSLPPNERYNISESSTSLNTISVVDIVDGVWDATAVNHLNTGSTGLLLNTTNASVQQLVTDIFTLIGSVETLLKMECNRTLIDKNAKTLTVFDDDGITPLKVFNLYDSNGLASVEEVCERVPIP